MALTTLRPRLRPMSNHQPKSRWGNSRGGRPWRRLREQVLARDLYTCQHCGQIGGQLEVDHIINVAHGGNDELYNLQTLCKICHDKKTKAESHAGGIKKF